jgi:hypothetical protein
MITIGIDEFGHFNLKDNNLSFVGGYIYEGDDYEDERRRLDSFFEQICQSLNIIYPYDMHLNKDGSNGSKVYLFETEVEEPLKEYMRQSGRYRLTCMVKSREAREDYKNICNLIDDEKANNLYEHMACGLLENLIFNNLVLAKEKSIRLEIPTRVSVVDDNDTEKINQFNTLGYSGKTIVKRGKLQHLFYSTDQKTFKAALGARIINSPRKGDIEFKAINVQSIDYGNRRPEMSFLYLADIICNNLKKRFKYMLEDFGLNDVFTWSKEYTGGNEPLFWVYDDMDSRYKKVMENFFNKDFLGTLQSLYEAREHESVFLDYFEKHWFRKIDNNIEQCFDVLNINVYAAEMDKFYNKSVVNYELGVYMIDKLWQMVIKHEDKINPLFKYRISDVGIRAYNHIGSSRATNPYVDICEKLKDKVGIDEYINTLNRAVQVYVNEFNFEEAIKIQKYTLDCQEILLKAKKDIKELLEVQGDKAVKSIELGRTLSSLGQFYAFTRSQAAEGYFENALKQFEGSKGNEAITRSHMLNFASDTENKELYEKHASKYFDSKSNIKTQLEAIISSKVEDPFVFYTYLKGVRNLYLDEVDKELLKMLRACDFEKVDEVNDSNHPWQLIYRNIGMILMEKNCRKEAHEFMQKAASCVSKPNETIKIINYFTLIEDAFHMGYNKKLGEHIEELKNYLQKYPRIKEYFTEALKGENTEIYRKLKDKFTFTYL